MAHLLMAAVQYHRAPLAAGNDLVQCCGPRWSMVSSYAEHGLTGDRLVPSPLPRRLLRGAESRRLLRRRPLQSRSFRWSGRSGLLRIPDSCSPAEVRCRPGLGRWYCLSVTYFPDPFPIRPTVASRPRACSSLRRRVSNRSMPRLRPLRCRTSPRRLFPSDRRTFCMRCSRSFFRAWRSVVRAPF